MANKGTVLDKDTRFEKETDITPIRRSRSK